MDKHIVRDRNAVAQALTSLKTFETWTQTKFESFSQHFRIKRHRKGEIILEKGSDIEDILMVQKGRLRLQKNLTFTNQNIWPSTEKAPSNAFNKSR